MGDKLPNGSCKRPQRKTKLIEPNNEMVNPIAERIGTLLINSELDCMDSSCTLEERYETVKYALNAVIATKFLETVRSLVYTMKGIKSESTSAPNQSSASSASSSDLRKDLKDSSASEGSAVESDSSDEGPPGKKQKQQNRKPSSPKSIVDLKYGFKLLSVTLENLNCKARNRALSLDERQKLVWIALNAVNAPKILHKIQDLKVSYANIHQEYNFITDIGGANTSTYATVINSIAVNVVELEKYVGAEVLHEESERN